MTISTEMVKFVVLNLIVSVVSASFSGHLNCALVHISPSFIVNNDSKQAVKVRYGEKAMGDRRSTMLVP